MVAILQIPVVIYAACVLHNFIIKKTGADEDDIDCPEDNSSDEPSPGSAPSGSATGKRLEIARSLY